jgi:hypothetical protein
VSPESIILCIASLPVVYLCVNCDPKFSDQFVGMQEKYAEFSVMIQKPNTSPFNRKAHPLQSEESEANQIKHQEHVGDLFDGKFIFHQKFVLPGLTVNQHYNQEH